MTELSGYSEPRKPSDYNWPNRNALETARADVSHEGVSIYFCESHEKKKRGVDGRIDVSCFQMGGIILEMIEAMHKKIIELEDKNSCIDKYLRSEIGERQRLLDAAYDIIIRSADSDCDYEQAKTLVERRAREIQEAKRSERFHDQLQGECEPNE